MCSHAPHRSGRSAIDFASRALLTAAGTMPGDGGVCQGLSTIWSRSARCGARRTATTSVLYLHGGRLLDVRSQFAVQQRFNAAVRESAAITCDSGGHLPADHKQRVGMEIRPTVKTPTDGCGLRG